MSTKTRSNFVPLLVGVAVVAVAAVALLPNLRTSSVDDREETALVTVTFTPDRRTGEAPEGRQLKDAVAVEVEMRPDVQHKYTVLRPWSVSMWPRKGQRLWVKASQLYGTAISCTIVVNGVLKSQDRNTGPRSVSCSYTRAR